MSKNNLRLGLTSLKVNYKGQRVGLLALTNDKKVAFSYADEWLENGFSISPFSLPLEKKVFIPANYFFDGLFGIFADSLPDAWGRRLLDRMLQEHGLGSDVTVLDRLALVGKNGMGALEYEPNYELGEKKESYDLDYLSEQCQKILMTEYADDLDMIYRMGGSSGGARPKVLATFDDKNWIIKFPAHFDSKKVGKMEYEYSKCAIKCGIPMEETKLYSSDVCDGYFGTVRFDRVSDNGKKVKVHMATAAALLEADFRAPCMDYHTLMKLTRVLTLNNKQEVESMFRRIGKISKELSNIQNSEFGFLGDEIRFVTLYDFVKYMLMNLISDAEKKNIDLGYDKQFFQEQLESDKDFFKEVTHASLVHWDMWEGNVFVKDGHVSGIIDWERALWGEPFMDDRFRMHNRGQDFLEGFGQTSFSEDEQKRMRWYDVILYLTMMIEVFYREFEDKGQYFWAKEMLEKSM